MASDSGLRSVLLRLLLPLAQPPVLPPLAVPDGGRCRSRGTAGGPHGVAFTSQHAGASGPAPGDLGSVGSGLGPQQDRHQQ